MEFPRQERSQLFTRESRAGRVCNAQKRSGEALDHFIVKTKAPKSCINSPRKHKSVFAK